MRGIGDDGIAGYIVVSSSKQRLYVGEYCLAELDGVRRGCVVRDADLTKIRSEYEHVAPGHRHSAGLRWSPARRKC